jgi:hypothetical protein
MMNREQKGKEAVVAYCKKISQYLLAVTEEKH